MDLWRPGRAAGWVNFAADSIIRQAGSFREKKTQPHCLGGNGPPARGLMCYFLESRHENAPILASAVSKLFAPVSSVIVRKTHSLCCSAVRLKVKTSGSPINGLYRTVRRTTGKTSLVK